jgi:hypothetical protein
VNFNLYDFYRDIKGKRIISCYSGPIAHVGLEGIAQALRRNLEMEHNNGNSTQAVFSVFIEQMQNVLNYSAERPGHTAAETGDETGPDLRVGIVLVGQEDDGYFILCGNNIYDLDKERIAARIEEVRNLGKDELKTLYKERRRQTPEQGSKGAGLGLIEMARKAGKPIEYAFTPVDDTFSFFSIKVVVRREDMKR